MPANSSLLLIHAALLYAGRNIILPSAEQLLHETADVQVNLSGFLMPLAPVSMHDRTSFSMYMTSLGEGNCMKVEDNTGAVLTNLTWPWMLFVGSKEARTIVIGITIRQCGRDCGI